MRQSGEEDEVVLSADPRWGSRCVAYNLQIPLADDTARRVQELQSRLSSALALPLLLIPRTALHVSVYSIIPGSWDAPNKDAAWKSLASAALPAIARRCRDTAAFSFALADVRLTRFALILTAKPYPPFFDHIRRELGDLVETAHVPRSNYDIVHMTLARFAESKRVTSAAARTLEAVAADVHVEVKQLELVREMVYPTLACEVITSYALLGTSR